MTGTNNDRQPDLLDDFWNALRSNPATQPPSELDPSTADFVRDIERELHPSDPNARFVATLRTRLHRASPLASQADGVVTMMPPAVTTTPRAGSDTTPERPIIKRFGSVGRELLEIAAIVVVVVVVALLLRQVFRDDPNDGQLADQGTEGVGVPPGDDTLPIYQIAISAYAEDDAGKQLLLVEADGSTLVPLTQPSDVAFYVGMSSWSPDGSKVVYVGPASGGDLIVQNLMTGESYSLPGTTNATWPRWSPDGSTIAFVALNASRGHDVFVVPSSGGEPRNLTNNEAEEFIPTWSPDGSMLAFAAHDGSRSGIYVIDSDGSNLRNVSNQPVDVTGPSWSPDGTRIAFNSHPNGNADIYVTDLTTNVVSNITNSPDAELHAVWSPDGETIAYTHLASDTEGLTNLWLMDADGTNRRELIADDAYATIHAVWSPDGERLAATMQPFGQQDTVLWSLVVVNRDGSDYRVLSDRAAELDAPAWRPGTNADVVLDIFAPGQSPTPTIIPSHAPTPLSEPGSAPTGELLISTRSDGEQRLLIIAVDGSQMRQLVPDEALDGDQWGGVWSPDGSQVAFSVQRDGPSDVYVINADGSNLRQLVPTPPQPDPPIPNRVLTQGNPAWSPDGTKIAFASSRAWDRGGLDIYVVNADGSDLQRLTDDPSFEESPLESRRLNDRVRGPRRRRRPLRQHLRHEL